MMMEDEERAIVDYLGFYVKYLLAENNSMNLQQIYNLLSDFGLEYRILNSYVNIRGDIIKGNSQRFQTFFTKGLKCSCCGIEGKCRVMQQIK